VSEWTVDTVKEWVASQLMERDKAIGKLEAQTEKRFDAANEIKQAMADQAATFITRAEAMASMSRNAEDIKAATDRLNLSQGRDAAGSDSWARWLAILAVLVALGGLIFHK
jgi:hypothetical protein